jgi:DNA invertase Pin-like site-specific DNA recombinase
MQAADGLSLDAQEAAIGQYCAAHGYVLVKICKDVLSGGKSDRPGLQEALKLLERSADLLVVLKFDRLSRSIKHFCELYEQYFKDGRKELVAIRESIRLDSSLGRALVSILLVFAQMEREATGERTREAIRHLRNRGYHFGKVPYGMRTVPAQDNPRFRVLVEEPEEQRALQLIREMLADKQPSREIVSRLNGLGMKPPQGEKWTQSLLYNLRVRQKLQKPRPHNVRPHSDEDVRDRMVELHNDGHVPREIAERLNREDFVPLKGSRFTEKSVRGLLSRTEEAKHMTPKRFLEVLLERMQREHEEHFPDEQWPKPGYGKLARYLMQAGYVTPRGHTHWWPAQVQQLMEGHFDQHYARAKEVPVS